MKYYTIQAPGDLADHIQFFWVLEGSASEDHPFLHRALADCSPELIFYYKGYFNISTATNETGRSFTSGIYGQSQQFKKLAATTGFGIFGVYFYPYAIPQVFSLPASALSEQMPDLKTLCGKEGEILEQEVLLALNNRQRAKLVSGFVRKRLRNSVQQNPGIVHLIKNILQHKEQVAVHALAKECNLSRRQFERVFKDHAGFSPKVFLDLVRFNSIIKDRSGKPLTKITYDYGFFDQPHFIHHFRKFSGYTPHEYFRQQQVPVDYRATIEFKL